MIPREYAEAWRLREDFPLEVHRVGRTSEEDEPAALEAALKRVMAIHEEMMPRHDAAYRELAKGPEGVGPHEPAPFDLKRW